MSDNPPSLATERVASPTSDWATETNKILGNDPNAATGTTPSDTLSTPQTAHPVPTTTNAPGASAPIPQATATEQHKPQLTSNYSALSTPGLELPGAFPREAAASSASQSATSSLPDAKVVQGAVVGAAADTATLAASAVEAIKEQLPAKETVAGPVNDAAATASTHVPARDTVTGTASDAATTVTNTANDAAAVVGSYVPATADVTNALSSMGQTAASYVPQGLKDTVAAYLPSTAASNTASASEHDTAHDKSLPSSETPGSLLSNPIPDATKSETGLARLPDDTSSATAPNVTSTQVTGAPVTVGTTGAGISNDEDSNSQIGGIGASTDPNVFPPAGSDAVGTSKAEGPKGIEGVTVADVPTVPSDPVTRGEESTHGKSLPEGGAVAATAATAAAEVNASDIAPGLRVGPIAGADENSQLAGANVLGTSKAEGPKGVEGVTMADVPTVPDTEVTRGEKDVQGKSLPSGGIKSEGFALPPKAVDQSQGLTSEPELANTNTPAPPASLIPGHPGSSSPPVISSTAGHEFAGNTATATSPISAADATTAAPVTGGATANIDNAADVQPMTTAATNETEKNESLATKDNVAETNKPTSTTGKSGGREPSSVVPPSSYIPGLSAAETPSESEAMSMIPRNTNASGDVDTNTPIRDVDADADADDSPDYFTREMNQAATAGTPMTPSAARAMAGILSSALVEAGSSTSLLSSLQSVSVPPSPSSEKDEKEREEKTGGDRSRTGVSSGPPGAGSGVGAVTAEATGNGGTKKTKFMDKVKDIAGKLGGKQGKK